MVAFHSLEDRRVKAFLKTRAGKSGGASRHVPSAPTDARATPTFKLLSNRPLRPQADETTANPRARSARMRAAERTSAAAWRQEAA